MSTPPDVARGQLSGRPAEALTHLPEFDRSRTPIHALQTYPAGVELFAQGSCVHDVYLLQQGLVKLVHTDENGRERILDLRLPAGLVGGACAVLQVASPVSAITATPCLIRRLPRHEFLGALTSDTQFAWAVTQLWCDEVNGQLRRLAELGAAPARLQLERVISTLADNASMSPGPRLQLPLKRFELAQWLGVTPEHLSRLFRQLVEEGVIGFNKGWLTVRDRARLASGNGAQRLAPDVSGAAVVWGRLSA